MASLLRQIIARPRAKHQDSNLDLCYVTPFLIATSGPSGTYPQKAYRNSLDDLVQFLDKSHGEEWCIWEFRAEGTGYPDSEVYGRVKHYPWPDHHPPPFRVVPLVMQSMRQWLGDRDVSEQTSTQGDGGADKKRVVIVHCKAGKGRSGTMAASYLISQCGWSMQDALARFTERRMRTGWGEGVSIPSQLRYVGYVDRWTKGGKKYMDRSVEIMEIHVWGLRDGVKVAVEAYVDEGKVIQVYHVFNQKERLVVEGKAPGGQGAIDMFTDMAGYGKANASKSNTSAEMSKDDVPIGAKIDESRRKATVSFGSNTRIKHSTSSDDEAGGSAVLFKPRHPLIVPSSDINIDFERRNKAPYSGLTMVTSVAHVWFNTFFEGNGPEQNGKPNSSGTFVMEWENMDGIKGSHRKGTRAFDHMAVVWRLPDLTIYNSGELIQPREDEPVRDLAAADWKHGTPESAKSLASDLGFRNETPASTDISTASSMTSLGDEQPRSLRSPTDSDTESLKGTRTSGMLHEGTADFGELGHTNRNVSATGTMPDHTTPRVGSGNESLADIAAKLRVQRQSAAADGL